MLINFVSPAKCKFHKGGNLCLLCSLMYASVWNNARHIAGTHIICLMKE